MELTIDIMREDAIFDYTDISSYLKNNQKVSTLLTQLSWSGNLLILSNTKTDEERGFYLNWIYVYLK